MIERHSGQEDPADQGGADDPEQLAPDQFIVLIYPSGRVAYEFASPSAAERFFGSRVATTKEALRALVADLIAETAVAPAPRLAKTKAAPVDRNLVTVREFAEFLDCAESSVFEMLKLGLPSIKSPKLGRRILKAEADAWLRAGGASTSRAAKRLRKASGSKNGR